MSAGVQESQGRNSSFRRATQMSPVTTGVATAGVVASVMLSLISVPAAQAAVGDACGDTGGFFINDTTCEIAFLTPGDTTWTPPAGTTKLDALLVGAGGAGRGWLSGGGNVYNAYGGGGGDVQVVSLSASGEVAITVGFAGEINTLDGFDSTVTQGATSAVAAGGQSVSDARAASGNGNNGYIGWYNESGKSAAYGGGGGAAGDTTNSGGGDGAVVNTLAGASGTLFADDTRCFGNGGGSADYNYSWTTAWWSYPWCGGGAVALQLDDANAYVSHTITAPVANSGSGGAGWYLVPDAVSSEIVGAQNGADGAVFLRYDYTLPNTSAAHSVNEMTTWLSVAGIAIAAGAIASALSLVRRRRV